MVIANPQTSIENMVVQAIIDRLIEKMQVPFASEDETRLNAVGVGKLQKNPNIPGTFIMIRPSTKQERHGLDDQDPYIKAPISTVGGKNVAFYRNRYTLEVGMYFKGKESFKESLFQANLVLARLKHALMTMPIVQGRDTFGEGMWHAPILYSKFIEEGGARVGPNNYRGDVLIDIYTVFSPT